MNPTPSRFHPLRLSPGQDLRRALEAELTRLACPAAFVVSGIGSLTSAQLRLAGAPAATPLGGDIEILTLAGSLSPVASHLHASLSLADGTVLGGHVAYGCPVRTTAEVLLALLPDWRFSREADPSTGFHELVIRPAALP